MLDRPGRRLVRFFSVLHARPERHIASGFNLLIKA
jgi:hypothetical protein